MKMAQEAKKTFPEENKKISISVVLPCHNEAENIVPAVKEALEVLKKIALEFELVIVNDGSTDNTGSIAEELKNEEPKIKVIHHPKNLGYGCALRSGFELASFPFIFYTDADRQFEIAQLNLLVEKLDQTQMVVGYRAPRKDPLIRKILGDIFSFLIRSLFKIKARDINCAFKIFPRSLIEGKKLISKGALISAELFILAKKSAIEPIEVPVSHFPRKTGKQSGASFKVITRALVEIWKLYKFYKPQRDSYSSNSSSIYS